MGAEDVSGAGVRVLDIRGTPVATAVPPVLADPSGVRARRLARAGRAVAFLCLLWLVGLGLAGIGILPTDDLPLGHAITGAAPGVFGLAPAAPRRVDPAGARATNTDAASAGAERADRTRSRAYPTTQGTRHATSPGESGSGAIGRSPVRLTTRRPVRGLPGPGSGGRTTTTTETTTGSSAAPSGPNQAASAGVSNSGTHAIGRGIASAPGATTKAATPGHTGTTARRNSGGAPGQVNRPATTVTTAPGQSGSSSGHTATTGGGHGNST
ncbi:MAG TPA: hypothetical protein VFH80_14525 [Solirubrobacteraceae bacterium]|nr:hypothetical protein [Solirubrobacteraceae bacterium]